ncbi:MAG: hypothetical protein GDA68_19230 [Nitrospira sp. CR2.1]|nr:hypothetical protein [Nitrospira sp. CR2.1]
MRWNPVHQCLTMAVVGVLCVGGLSGRAAADERIQPATLGLSGLIQEVLARNPERQAARQQWEAASKRVPQARSLEDPTLSVQWWNAPESFNLGRAENTIIGLLSRPKLVVRKSPI